MRLLALLWHATEPVDEDGGRDVEHTVSPQDTKIAPTVGITNAHLAQEYIRLVIGAVIAVARIARIAEIATSQVYESLHVSFACLATWGLQGDEFVFSASGVLISDTSRQHAFHQVCEWRDPVHKDPKSRKRFWLLKNTTEDQRQREQQVANVSGRLGVGYTSNHHVRKSGGEEQEHPGEQEEFETPDVNSVRWCGIVVESNWVIEAEEDDNGHERVPGEFYQDVCCHKCLPAVGLGGPLPDFVERTLRHEMRHYLLRKLTEDGEEHEYGKHLVLQALMRKRCVVKNETCAVLASE